MAVEILMRHNPRARIIWAHTGFGLSTDRVAEMLSKYPKLWGELSYRGGIVDGSGKLTAEWRALFERFPTASCSAPTPGSTSAGRATATSWPGYRAWLAQLPPKTAAQIANGNARALFGGER